MKFCQICVSALVLKIFHKLLQFFPEDFFSAFNNCIKNSFRILYEFFQKNYCNFFATSYCASYRFSSRNFCVIFHEILPTISLRVSSRNPSVFSLKISLRFFLEKSLIILPEIRLEISLRVPSKASPRIIF